MQCEALASGPLLLDAQTDMPQKFGTGSSFSNPTCESGAVPKSIPRQETGLVTSENPCLEIPNLMIRTKRELCSKLWAFFRNSNSRQVLAALPVDINKLPIEVGNFHSSGYFIVSLGD